MDFQSCDYSGGQNWKPPASQNSSELPIPDAAEVSGQTKQLGQLDMSSSREKTQSTNETTKSLSMETLKQPTLHIPDCYLNNKSEVHENGVEASERYQKNFFYEGRHDGEDAGNVLAALSKPASEFLESDSELFFSRNCFDEEEKENAVKPMEAENDPPSYQNYLFDDPFSTVPNHAINMTAQDHDLNFGIAQDIGIAPAKEDIPQSKPKKVSKPFTIIRNDKPPQSNNTRNRKKRGPKPSFTTNTNVKPDQLKIIRSHNNRCPDEWDREMNRDLERISEQDFQPLQMQNSNSDYDVCNYFRSSADNNYPYVSDSNVNKMFDGFWLNRECDEVFDAYKTENLGLVNNMNIMIQVGLISFLGDPSAAVAQPSTSEPSEASQLEKSEAGPKKKIKTSSQTFALKKSSPSDSSTQMGSEKGFEDEYGKSQNKRETKRKPKNIQNKNLNVINGTANDLPPQPKPRRAKASRQLTDDEILKLTFGASDIRTSFFTVVVNQMFALLKDKNLGKEFRDAIKQETWFKVLVERAKWFEPVFQASQSSRKTLQRVEVFSETIQAAEFHGQIEELDQEARSYEEDLYAARQGEGEMRPKWYQEAKRWKDLQSVICGYEWAKTHKKTLPQDQCNKCCQFYACDECREFGNLYTLLYAIYKKGINQKGQESTEIRSLEKFSEVVGNKRYSATDYIMEMDLKEFCQKAASSVMATFLKEEEQFYEIAIDKHYHPQRNYEKQDNEKKVLCDDTKKKLHLRFKSDIRERFAAPEAFPALSKKMKKAN